MLRKMYIYDLVNKIQYEELEFDTDDFRVIIKDNQDRIVYYSSYEPMGLKHEETTIPTDKETA